MDESRNTNTSTRKEQRGLAPFGDELPKNIGPFHRGEVETIARRCAKRVGIEFDEIPIAEQKQKLGIALDVLTCQLPVRRLEDVRSNVPSDERTFGLMLLEEFRNSPKWDIDEFNRGYLATNVDTPLKKNAGDVGGVDPAVESNR